jgi:hypothetical protein
MGNFDPINPLAGTVRRADAGDFIGLRQEYRKRALINLRRREGIPVPEFVDGRWMYLCDDGEYHCQAVGHRRQPDSSVMDEFWGSNQAPFEMLEVADDGIPLTKEIDDLGRDAKGFERAEHVSFGGKEVPYPDFVVNDPNDDSEVDHAVQEYIKRHA